MLLLWVLNRNSSPPNILDKPAQNALTLKINFEELENFAMENHGGHTTILSFASNKNACNTEKEGLIFFFFFNSSSKYLWNTLYIPGTVTDTVNFLGYKTDQNYPSKIQSPAIMGLYSMTRGNKHVNKAFI